MRTDYPLYILAVICILFSVVLWSLYQEQYLYAITLLIIGIIFAITGYALRPKVTIRTRIEEKRVETAEREEVSTPPAPPTIPKETKEVNLTEIKGIGPKRANQLKKLGISTAEDLAKMDPQELSSKVGISQTAAQRWIERAKKTLEKD